MSTATSSFKNLSATERIVLVIKLLKLCIGILLLGEFKLQVEFDKINITRNGKKIKEMK